MKKPRDIVQTSEKLWLAAAFAVKEKLEEVGCLPVTHNALNKGFKFIELSTKDGKDRLLLQATWSVAQWLLNSAG